MRTFNVDVEKLDALLESLWSESECQDTQIEITLIPSKQQLIVRDEEEDLAQINLIKVHDEYDVVHNLFDLL